eukprot:575942_1
MSSDKIDFEVCFVSSEEEGFPGSELEVRNQKTKGWQSGRFCDCPQELIVPSRKSFPSNKFRFCRTNRKLLVASSSMWEVGRIGGGFSSRDSDICHSIRTNEATSTRANSNPYILTGAPNS